MYSDLLDTYNYRHWIIICSFVVGNFCLLLDLHYRKNSLGSLQKNNEIRNKCVISMGHVPQPHRAADRKKKENKYLQAVPH